MMAFIYQWQVWLIDTRQSSLVWELSAIGEKEGHAQYIAEESGLIHDLRTECREERRSIGESVDGC